MKSPNGKLNTNFHNNKITKGGSQCICLSVILIDSVMRASSNYYPQVFLEECKYYAKGKKMSKYIVDGIEISSDSDREHSDEKNSAEKILIKKILMKRIKKYSYSKINF